MKRIAIVTGASSGMGQWFARTAAEYVKYDELWIIARRADRLEALAAELERTASRGGRAEELERTASRGARGEELEGVATRGGRGEELEGAASSGGQAAELESAATRGAHAEELERTASSVGQAEELERAASSGAAGSIDSSTGCTVRPVPMDLTDSTAVSLLADMLRESDAEVVLLVNAAGFGKFQAVSDVPQQMADSMLALNCKALMDMCYTVIPFMKGGAKILNIASVAAFQPVPYVTEYAATKAFVLSFSRGLWKELRSKGITVTALCPYWTRTEFFDVANNRDSKDMVNYFNAMYEPEDVVRRGWRDLMTGRDVSTYGFTARAQIVLVKLLPHRLVMRVWCHQQKIKG